MYNLTTKRIATVGLLVTLSLFVVLHGLILLRVIPYEMVWGGRLKNESQMLAFEAVSLIVNLLMMMAVAAHAGMLKTNINRQVLRTVLWAMFGLFLLNTLGNALSDNHIERTLFTPLTLLLSAFSLRLAMSREAGHSYRP